jgi:plastocyanin
MGRLLLSALLCASLTCGYTRVASAADPAGGGHAHTVLIDSVQFKPQELTVHQGDRIVWVNKDPFPHTVTADAKAFDSQSLAPEASWTYIARKPGKYAYHCTLHPTMTGTIIVK